MAYDYVIAGGGSAGCDAGRAAVRGPGRHGLPDRSRRRRQEHPDPRAARRGRRCFPAGRGSATGRSRPCRSPASAAAEATSRAARRSADRAPSTPCSMCAAIPSDYDDWAELGCDGWSWNDVLPYFRRAEGNERGADALHGADGPLQVVEPEEPAAAGTGLPRSLRREPDPRQRGFQRTRAGRRRPLPGHAVPGRATQRRTLLGRRRLSASGDGPPEPDRHHRRACDRHRLRRQARDRRALSRKAAATRSRGAPRGDPVRRRVRLAAAAACCRASVRPTSSRGTASLSVHELPGVGQNLQDHLDFILAWTSKDADMIGIGLRGVVDLVRQIRRWRRDGTGLIATPFAEAGAFLKSEPSLDRPDLQLHFVIAHGRRSRPQAASRLRLLLPCLRAQAVLARRGRPDRRQPAVAAAHRPALPLRRARRGAAAQGRQDRRAASSKRRRWQSTGTRKSTPPASPPMPS